MAAAAAASVTKAQNKGILNFVLGIQLITIMVIMYNK
jgi:hypothetical protein